MNAAEGLPCPRYVVATGLAGYGPDAADDSFSVCTDWASLADAVASELRDLAEMMHETAEACAGQEEYKYAWLTMKRAEQTEGLAASLDNARQDAPLYKDNPRLWHETIRDIVTANFPYAGDGPCQLYVWQSNTFGADDEDES
jgi:hypothetical protein